MERTYTIFLSGRVDRKTGEITFETRQGTREEFIQSIRPFVEMGQYVRDCERKEMEAKREAK